MSKGLYKSAMMNLMYAIVGTMIDIIHVVRVVNRFMKILGKQYWTIVKWILRYLKGTKEYVLKYDD